MSYCCVVLYKVLQMHIPQTYLTQSPLYSTLSQLTTLPHLIIRHYTITAQHPPQWSVEPSGKSGKSGVHTGPHPKPPPVSWEQHPPPVSWGSEWHSESGKSGKSGLTTTESSWWSPPPHPMPHEEGWGSSAKSNKESWWSPPPPSWEEGLWGGKATKHHKSSKSKSAKSMHIWNEGGSGGWWMSSDGKLLIGFCFLCI